MVNVNPDDLLDLAAYVDSIADEMFERVDVMRHMKDLEVISDKLRSLAA